MSIEFDNVHEWIQYGVEKGWISPTFCFTHDGDSYMNEEEQAQWEEGGDPCCHVVKFINA